MLVIDEHGDRKWGRKTAHVGRQYLANLGKTDSGVVSVTSLWADETVYWPVVYEPYTPQHHFVQGKADPAFRTKLAIAGELVTAAVADGLPFRAVVADSFYGEERASGGPCRSYGSATCSRSSRRTAGGIRRAASAHRGRRRSSRAGRATPRRGPGSRSRAASATGTRRRGGRSKLRPDCMGRRGLRAVVVTTDPATLPDHTTWYLATNLPARDADLAEVVRLYGLRMWVEQAYKHTKHALGWAQYQVRSDAAIRRHWQLVCCAFTFCWRQWPPSAGVAASAEGEDREEPAVDAAAGPGENTRRTPTGVLADGAAGRPRLAGAVGPAPALPARLVAAAPAPTARGPARPALSRPRA